MSSHPKFAVLRWTARLVLVAVAITLLSPTRAAVAQSVVMVEEDWELVLGEPDPLICGPQIVTTMSPFGDINDTYFTLEINHRSMPYWTPGGLTIHQWSGEWRMQSFDRADRTVMDSAGETVTWTQALYCNSGQITFEVKNGNSSTWGPFGYSGMFKLHTNWGVNNINSYTPNVSIAQSGVAYAGNRVQSLKIKQIRLTLDDGTVVTDNTERQVHLLIE
jgi:hypothetical protein